MTTRRPGKMSLGGADAGGTTTVRSAVLLLLLLVRVPPAAPWPFADGGNDTRIVDVVYELADLAFARLVTRNCYEAYDSEKCNELSDISAKDVRLYYGGLRADNDTVVAVLPDNDAQLAATDRPHDAYLVLDPFPAYKFGHPVFMFHVDFAVDAWKCEDIEGVHIGKRVATINDYDDAVDRGTATAVTASVLISRTPYPEYRR